MSDQGMRFKRIEVRNFGTWTGAVAHVFDMNRAGAVIAGENGAGKSTMMDALITLFSPTVKVSFNAAASATGKSSRSIADYYKGTHGSTEEEGKASQSKAIVLRSFGDEAATMALAAVMENADGDVFTVVKTLFFTADGTAKWRYITGNADLSINTHFEGYPSGRDLSARAQRFGFTVHDNLASYWSAVAEGLGLPNADHARRAFRTMIVAMAVPEMSSVTDFVRDHILPPVDLIQDGQSYVELLEKNGRVQEEIRRVKRRTESLEGVVNVIDAMEANISKMTSLQSNETRISAVQNYVLFHNFRHEKTRKERELRTATQRIISINARMHALNGALDEIKAARVAGGTADVERLRKDLDNAVRTRVGKQDQLTKLLSSAGQFAQVNAVDDADSWARLVKTANKVMTESAAAIAENQDFLQTVSANIRTAETEIARVEAEAESMRRNSSGVDADLIGIRAELARTLGVGTDDLPFFAELVQVKDSEAKVWESALNKLLRSLSTVIFMRDTQYAQAKMALAGLKGRSLVRIEEVWADDMGLADGRAIRELATHAAAHLLDVKEDSPFGLHVERLLAINANHVCIADQDAHKALGRAISPSGTIMTSKSKAQNDKRQLRNVLGWSMEGRIAVLEAQIETMRADLATLRDHKTQAEGGIAVQMAKHKSAEFFLMAKPDDWSDVDPAEAVAAEAGIRETLERLEAQEKASGLAQEEARVSTEIRDLSEEKDGLNRSIGQMERTVAVFTTDMREAQSQLAFLRESGKIMAAADYRSIRALIRTAMEEKGLTGKGLLIGPMREDVTKLFRTITSTVSTTINRSKAEINRAESLLNNLAGKHGQIFIEDANTLSFSLSGPDRTAHEKRQAWRDRLIQVRDQDLQAAEAKMKEFSRLSLNQALTQIRMTVKEYESEVRSLIGGINQSMAGNVYSPSSGSHAMISLTNAKDPHHQDLDRLLDAALDELHQKSDADFYADAAKIAEFIRDDDSSLQRSRRARLSNLANRYNAAVKERVTQEDGVEKVVRVITGAGALSGGEKERMNVFLLSAALKTVFRSALRPELSLGVFVVDEAFSKSSDESTRAAIEVVDSFGHQMIIATPMAKLLPFEHVSESVFLVSRPQNAHSVKQVIKMRTLVDEIKDEVGDAA